MRSLQRSSTAIRVALALAGLAYVGAALAAPPAGIVTRLEGPLLAQKANGRTRVIAQGSAVEAGDTLFTGNGTYAEIRFADDSDAILQPETQLAIEVFPPDASPATHEAARWVLVQGGMRVASGRLAAQGIDRHSIDTPFGTVAVTPSKFTLAVTPGASAPVALAGRVYLAANSTATMTDAPQPIVVAETSSAPYVPPPLAPGLHLSVTDGAIIVTNNGGSLGFQAGQFGYVPGVNQPPVIVPGNPNIQFVPPPSFDPGSGGPTGSSGPGPGQATDCIVR
jgi:hypothetical protein